MFEFLDSFEEVRGVYYPGGEMRYAEFSQLYLEARRLEGRVCIDEVVQSLPRVGRTAANYGEWQIRAHSCLKLARYLEAKRRPLNILDIGCGNGWMANRIARIDRCYVTAVDLNLPELEQGARVFGGNGRLRFAYADVFADTLPQGAFDMITIAAAIQYFPSLDRLIARLLSLLTTPHSSEASNKTQIGEIHIIDSPFYGREEISGARERTRRHYASIGVPEMAGYYHHHTFDDLAKFSFTYMYNPSALANRIMRRAPSTHLSPFPWIRIV